MAQLTDLHSRESVEQLLMRSQEGPVALLKHSSSCGLSARGHAQFKALEEEEDLPLYRVVVQRDRDLSNHIAERTGVRHETPQVLVFHLGEVVFHASHHRVTTEAIRNAVREAAGSPPPSN